MMMNDQSGDQDREGFEKRKEALWYVSSMGLNPPLGVLVWRACGLAARNVLLFTTVDS
jgi:hypothetical protein